MGAVYTRVDRQSDLVRGINQLVDRDMGTSDVTAKQVRWTRYDGVEKDPHGGAALSSGNRTLLLRNTAGAHRATLLSGTAYDAAPSAANSVELVDDAGLFIGAGKSVRLYDAAGTDFVDLSSDADGGAVLGGSGAGAGRLTLTSLAGLASLSLSSHLQIGTNPAATGAVRLANAGGISARNAANSADISLIRSDASNNVLMGAFSGTAFAYVLGTTGIGLQVGGTVEASVTAGGVSIAGNLALAGSGARLQGDFSNATLASRAMVQSSTTNGQTSLGILPNGSSQIANVSVFNSSNLAATAQGALSALAAEIRLTSAHIGAAYLPLTIYNNGAEQARFPAAGGFEVAGATTLNGDLTLNASPWTTFAPGLTQNGARTVTVAYARYRVFGKLAVVQFQITCTNAGTSGFSIVVTGIPAAIQPARTGQMAVCGTLMVEDLSTTTFYHGVAYAATSTTIEAMAHATVGVSPIGATPAFALANGDVVSAALAYEIA